LFVYNPSHDRVFSVHLCVLIFLIPVSRHLFGFPHKVVTWIFETIKIKKVFVHARTDTENSTSWRFSSFQRMGDRGLAMYKILLNFCHFLWLGTWDTLVTYFTYKKEQSAQFRGLTKLYALKKLFL